MDVRIEPNGLVGTNVTDGMDCTNTHDSVGVGLGRDSLLDAAADSGNTATVASGAVKPHSSSTASSSMGGMGVTSAAYASADLVGPSPVVRQSPIGPTVVGDAIATPCGGA